MTDTNQNIGKPEPSVRDLLFSKNKTKSQIVKIEGKEIEVRQPSIGERMDIRNISMDPDGKRMNQLLFEINAIIRLCYYPGTDKLVFEGTDLEEFKKLPPDTDLEPLVKAVWELSFPVKDEVKN